MRNSYSHIVTLVFILAVLGVSAQENLTTFGLSFKPMISGSLLNEGDPSSSANGIEYRTDKAFGYSAGMVIRHNFTKLLAIETGINFTRRNFDLQVTDPANSYAFKQQFGVIAYEIPVQALVYIQLSKKIFMDAAFGMSADLYPSDIAVFGDENRVIMEGRRNSWFQVALTANLGWEWRTDKAGAFYIGATYHRSFGDIYGFLMEYNNDPGNIFSPSTRLLNTVNGNYLTLDFRYFFNADPDEQNKRRKSRKSVKKKTNP